MTNDDGRKPEGAPERSPRAGAGAPSGVEGNGPKRFSVRRKLAVVARLLRGEPLELVARETNVSVAKLTEWRDRALSGAATALKERERDDRDDEIARLKSKVGEITMDNELLYSKIAAMEVKRPWALRRWRRGARRSRPPLLAVMVWRVLRVCGVSRSPAPIALSKRRRTRHRVALVRSAPVRTPNWQIRSAVKETHTGCTAKATASYGRDCALLGFARAPAVCDG